MYLHLIIKFPASWELGHFKVHVAEYIYNI
jgi:hypothetical protein